MGRGERAGSGGDAGALPAAADGFFKETRSTGAKKQPSSEGAALQQQVELQRARDKTGSPKQLCREHSFRNGGSRLAWLDRSGRTCSHGQISRTCWYRSEKGSKGEGNMKTVNNLRGEV